MHNVLTTCDLCMNERCHENKSRVKKDLREEEGPHGWRRMQGEHKSKVKTRNNQCWKDYAGLYRPREDVCHSLKALKKPLKDCEREKERDRGMNVCVC